MKEYFFKIHIEGMNGYLYYSVEAESEQEAVDTVDYYMQSAPHIIEKLLRLYLPKLVKNILCLVVTMVLRVILDSLRWLRIC